MRPPLLRPDTRVVAGVCAGLAAHLGWSVNLTRALMVCSALAGGAGLLLYGWLWIMVPTADEKAGAAEMARNPRSVAENFARYLRHESQQYGEGRHTGNESRTPGAPGMPETPGGAPAAASAGAGRTAFLLGSRDILAGAALLAVAGALIAQQLGAGINWRILLPAGAIVLGAVLAWSQLDATRRAGLLNRAGANRTAGALRLAAGLALVVTGLLLILSGSLSWDLLVAGLLASLAVLAGVGLVFTPWMVKYWRDLETERAGRIRASERAEIAAHLHDSVLQTLALIQNRAGSEQDVVRLARAQERELRRWLYADEPRTPGQLVEQVSAVAAEVEDEYGHPVEVVAVGNAGPDARTDALAQAARAAMLNAAQHARGPVSVYVECTAGLAEVFVRDRGSGFDQKNVPTDRIGLRESIVGRMKRNGGSAMIRSGPEGTEVRLVLPLETPAAPATSTSEQT